MRGAYIQFQKEKGCCCSRKSSTVEQACALRKEEAELRLARIQNGKHPEYQNGKTLQVADGEQLPSRKPPVGRASGPR